MSKKQATSVRESAAISHDSFYNVRERIDISSQAHNARAIHTDTDYMEIDSDSEVYYRFDTVAQANIKTITAVTDNAGQAVFASEAHGYSNGNIVVQRAFSTSTYNVMATVANVTADTYELGITYVATGTGEAGLITDTISANKDIRLPDTTVIVRAIPWGESTKTSRARQSDMIVVHFKQVTSAATKYIRFVEL